MTDLEKLEKTFSELGIKYQKKTAFERRGLDIAIESYNGEAKYDIALTIEEGIGYSSFWCDFYFLEGKFINHGVWE